MVMQYTPDFIPETRAEALSLLRALDDNTDLLTEDQRQALRDMHLYFLDTQLRVADLVRSGEIHI